MHKFLKIAMLLLVVSVGIGLTTETLFMTGGGSDSLTAKVHGRKQQAKQKKAAKQHTMPQPGSTNGALGHSGACQTPLYCAPVGREMCKNAQNPCMPAPPANGVCGEGLYCTSGCPAGWLLCGR